MLSSNARSFAKGLEDWMDRFEERVGNEIDQAVRDTETYAKRETPVETGQLRRSIKADVNAGRVTVHAPYALEVHEGTRERPPNPFLERAAERAFREMIKRLTQ